MPNKIARLVFFTLFSCNAVFAEEKTVAVPFEDLPDAVKKQL